MLGSERRVLEIERRLEQSARELEAMRQRLTALGQLANALAGSGGNRSAGSGGFLCRADGAITARSGTTPGAGNVKRIKIDSGALTAIGDPIPVKNASATKMGTDGVKTGAYCWAAADPFGVWWVFPLECPDDVTAWPAGGGGPGEKPGDGTGAG